MKKTLLVVAILFGTLKANAQLPNGSISPNWTLTDVNGQSHTLYEYLDQGKTVVLDLFATWCGPCWNYTSSGVLGNVMSQYGPSGTDEIMVFAIEVDGTTPVSALYGSGNTQGNWVNLIGGAYPIIDAPELNEMYAVSAFPTVYMICPNKKTTVIGQLGNPSSYLSQANNCGSPTSAVDAFMMEYTGPTSICPDNLDAKVLIQNNGSAPLTSATINVKQGATTISTYNWTGNLGTYQTETISIPTIVAFNSGLTKFEIIASSDALTANNSKTLNIVAPEVNSDIQVQITTDYWSSEIDWQILDYAGSYVSGTAAPALAPNQYAEFEYNLQYTGCYTFSITDVYGDGILNGPTQTQGTQYGALWVGDGSGSVIFNEIDYGIGADTKFNVVSVVGIEEANIGTTNVYPNPSSGQISFEVLTNDSEESKAEVTDLLGNLVFTSLISSTEEGAKVKLNLGELSNGHYILRLTNGQVVSTANFQISK